MTKTNHARDDYPAAPVQDDAGGEKSTLLHAIWHPSRADFQEFG